MLLPVGNPYRFRVVALLLVFLFFTLVLENLFITCWCILARCGPRRLESFFAHRAFFRIILPRLCLDKSANEVGVSDSIRRFAGGAV